jgi:hypothetical protein
VFLAAGSDALELAVGIATGLPMAEELEVVALLLLLLLLLLVVVVVMVVFFLLLLMVVVVVVAMTVCIHFIIVLVVRDDGYSAKAVAIRTVKGGRRQGFGAPLENKVFSRA